MIPNPIARTKGGAPQLGILPGLEHIGPFGRHTDDQEQPAMASLANDRIAQQLEAARARRERERLRRQELAAARNRSLTLRHAQRLRNLAASEARLNRPAPDPMSNATPAASAA